MSFSVAFSCTCSPRALSASATSASSPTEAALLCCHGASPLSTRLPRKTNRKPQPLQHTRCGAVPSAVDRWPLSNDSLPHNSNSVRHRSWPRLHEITHPPTALSARFRAFSPKSVSIAPRHLLLVPASAHFRHRVIFAEVRQLLLHRLYAPRELLHPSLAPYNLHNSRIRHASGFLLTAFSNATPHTFF